MAVGRDLDALLALLTQALDEPDGDLRHAFDGVLEALGHAVPSFCGLTLVLAASRGPVRLSSHDDAHADAPRSSLWVRLGSLADEATEMIVHASVPGAFVDLAADLAWMLGRPLGEIVLDGHLEPGRVASSSLADASSIDQAVGVLLATGWAPDAAERRLDELAAELGGDRAVAARAVLAGLDDPQQGPPAASSRTFCLAQ